MVKKNLLRTRQGYTLIELMVVISIILGVMGLVVAIYPSYSQREDLYKSADLIRNSLMRARQWAIRDKAGTGIGIQTSPAGLGLQIVFYQDGPEVYGSNPITSVSNGLTISLQNAKNKNEVTLNPPLKNKKVLTGDFLIVTQSNTSTIHRITGTIPPQPLNTDQVATFYTSTDLSLSSATSKFKIFRGPRLLESEPPINLSQTVKLEFRDQNNSVIPIDPNKPSIIFSPKGQVEPTATGVYSVNVIQTDPQDPTTEIDRKIVTLEAVSGITKGR